MRKLKIFINRIKSMSFSRMFTIIKILSKESGKPQPLIFLDMVACSVFYGTGYLDYRVFGFVDIHGKKRKTFMTMNKNLSLVRKLNNPDYFEIFNDKTKFNSLFKDYIGRDWIDLRQTDEKGFTDFCQGKKTAFAKRVSSFGGQGVEKLKFDESTNFADLFKNLQSNGQYLIEEEIIQHDEMKKLSPTSINTLRIVTVLSKGKVNFMYSILRMGKGNSSIDNITSGGLYTVLNDSGVVTKPAFCDKTGLYYTVHPTTGMELKGFKVPFFKQAVELCKKAALVEPHMGYIGWDVAITADGPVLVEGNNFPSYDMVQNFAQTNEGIGILPKFEKILSMKI